MYFKPVPCLKNKTIKPIALIPSGEQVPCLPPVGPAPCGRVPSATCVGWRTHGRDTVESSAHVLEWFFQNLCGFSVPESRFHLEAFWD